MIIEGSINGSDVPEKKLKNKNFIIENKPFNDIIDAEIALNTFKIDNRIESINEHNFKNRHFNYLD